MVGKFFVFLKDQFFLLLKYKNNIIQADEAKAREIFNHFDRNHNGTIEAVELKTVLAELGRPLSDEEVAGLVSFLFLILKYY